MARKSMYGGDSPALSGNDYVPAQLRHTEDVPEQAAKLFKLRIVAPNRCKHVETICSNRRCLESWRRDHRIFFPRTRGGRVLWQLVYPGREIEST